MLAFPHSIRIFVAIEPVDMRKQYDGLWAAAQQQLGEAKRKLAFAPEALALLIGGVELRRGSLKPWDERDEK